MIIDLMVWASTREQFVTGMVQNGLATVEDGDLLPTEGVLIDELGPITKTPATFDAEGNEITPAVMVSGHHVNLRAYGQFAQQVTYGLLQEGDVFQRTHLLRIIQNLSFVPITAEGVPSGYEGPNGVRLFDPGVVNIPARVWA
tara:strand:+ start:496 stop:924 length:429 start_codon:yes stop_codon:yes gene_type:complete